MGRIGKLLSFLRAQTQHSAYLNKAKVDPGGGDNSIVPMFAPAGVDSQPLVGDYVALMDSTGTGKSVGVGAVDPVNPATADAGEVVLYSRDVATGAPVAWVRLLNDGSAIVENPAGSMTLQANGIVDINGVTIDASGNIVAASITTPSVVAGGLQLAGHTHIAGTPPGPTGVNQ